MKKSTKLLSLIISVLLLISSFASCTAGDPEESSTPEAEASTPVQSTPEETAGETTAESSSEETTEEPVITTEESSSQSLEDLIPPAINLDREMTVFVGTLHYDEWLKEDDGDLVGTELFYRVPRVEGNLGIELNVTTYGGRDRTYLMDEMKKRQETTDPNLIVDAVSTYSQFAGTLTLEGRYQNIAQSDNINFDSPWWPDDLLVNSTIDDKVYFVSGDISPTLIYETYAIFYNLQLIEKYNIENPIDLVNDHKWTLDKVIELTSGIYEDLDKTTAGPNYGDFFAFNFNDTAHIKAFPFAMGARVIEPDEKDGYVWSPIYTGARMETICDKMVDWIQNNPGVMTALESYMKGNDTFKDGNCIFTVGNFAYASHFLAGTGLNYAVVPCPLFDADQEQYYSYYGNPTSIWGIPSNVDVDDSAALLESLAADAYVYISPVLFERALKIKYVSGEVDGLSRMFDIIRDGLVFDACMFYNERLNSFYDGFADINAGVSSWSAQFNPFMQKGMKTRITDIVNTLRALPY